MSLVGHLLGLSSGAAAIPRALEMAVVQMLSRGEATLSHIMMWWIWCMLLATSTMSVVVVFVVVVVRLLWRRCE